MFSFFAFGVTAVFFISSLILLNGGRQPRFTVSGEHGTAGMSGLPTIEGAVFALIGLLLAFTISGALQRFDERRQLVVQEATAISTAFDRLALFQGDAHDLQSKLKDYTKARIELYQMPHDFSLSRRAEVWSPEQQAKIVELKNRIWNATVAACSQSDYRSAVH